MVTTRSPSGMNDDSAFSIVVFPVPVPPETRQFSFAFTQAARNASISGVALLMAIMSLTRSGEPPKRRIDTTGPALAGRGGVERERRDDGVDAGAVRQARVGHGRGFVDAAADARDDARDDLLQVR